MRKYIVGFVVGAVLTFAVQAGAATLLGSTIDAVIQVEVNGEYLGQAPVIDGTSYLPVRKLGEASGYNVEFGEGKATLTSKESVTVATAEEQPPIETGDPVANEAPAESNVVKETATIEQLQTSIDIAKANIAFTKENIKRAEELGDTKSADEQKKYLAEREANLTDFETRKAALEAK